LGYPPMGNCRLLAVLHRLHSMKQPMGRSCSSKPSQRLRRRSSLLQATIELPIHLPFSAHPSQLSGTDTARTIVYRESEHGRTMTAKLPDDDGECSGTYQLGDQQGGTWAVACTNGLSASGSIVAFGANKGTKGEGRDTQGRQVRFTVGETKQKYKAN
jgi:hypothetical protein